MPCFPSVTRVQPPSTAARNHGHLRRPGFGGHTPQRKRGLAERPLTPAPQGPARPLHRTRSLPPHEARPIAGATPVPALRLSPVPGAASSLRARRRQDHTGAGTARPGPPRGRGGEGVRGRGRGAAEASGRHTRAHGGARGGGGRGGRGGAGGGVGGRGVVPGRGGAGPRHLGPPGCYLPCRQPPSPSGLFVSCLLVLARLWREALLPCLGLCSRLY